MVTEEALNNNDELRAGGGLFANLFSEQNSKQSASLKEVTAAISELTKSIMRSSDDEKARESLQTALSTARNLTATSYPQRSIPQLIEHFSKHFEESKNMMDEAFAHIDLNRLSLGALHYYAEHEESIKTPSWKRRMHRFHKKLELDTVMELHDALFLMNVAYLATKEEIEEQINLFRNGTYELVYATTKGHPTEPAHFIMIQKEDKKPSGGFDLSWGKESVLDIVMCVRGSGDLGDFVSDAMLRATDFRQGKAHDGIARSGKYLANLHLDTIRRLWNMSGRDKVRLTLVGYSLGAGVASIVAMELNDQDFIDATAVGFGCPALLDLNQSVATKDYITTVVSDGDIVARMSGALISNMILDVMSYDWTHKALTDLKGLLDYVSEVLPMDSAKLTIMAWANKTLIEKEKPYFSTITKERLPQELYPPGNCIHIFRDGAGYTGTYTPCTFFDEVEFSRTMVDDHLIGPGYHPALLSLAREAKKDLNFDFPHDIMALNV